MTRLKFRSLEALVPGGVFMCVSVSLERDAGSTSQEKTKGVGRKGLGSFFVLHKMAHNVFIMTHNTCLDRNVKHSSKIASERGNPGPRGPMGPEVVPVWQHRDRSCRYGNTGA